MSPALVPDPIAQLRAAPRHDAGAIAQAGLLAVRAEQEEAALPILAAAHARHPREPRLAQALGLAARNTGDLETATAAFARAHQANPTDPLIAHSLARTRMEAGLPAVEAFAIARRLAPSDPTVILGETAARLAEGKAADADAGLDEIVTANPDWLDGHASLSRLRRMMASADITLSYRSALQARPGNAGLWLALCDTLILSQRFADVAPLLVRARAAIGSHPMIDLYDAAAADELGDVGRAAALFAKTPPTKDPASLAWHVRHAFRLRQFDRAVDLAERGVRRPGGRILWPYLALGWRLIGDPRWAWLEGDERFVRVVDLPDLDLGALAGRLRTLHVAREQPLDQSIRGGTQTDGPLFSRIEPEIVGLRAAIFRAVTDYVAMLPRSDPDHPLLGPARSPIRFAGSWSVRLTAGGFHADHVHPQGWISSAFYVSLPEGGDPTAHQGWLALGAAKSLVPDLEPASMVEPAAGRLVLFPSTMWHGTVPFPAGERLTVAFDVALRGAG